MLCQLSYVGAADEYDRPSAQGVKKGIGEQHGISQKGSNYELGIRNYEIRNHLRFRMALSAGLS